MERPKCYLCEQDNFRLIYSEEIYKAKAPKSQKTILDIIKHISRVLKVTFKVPAKARVCTFCYKEIVRYDYFVVSLLEVQKGLSEKINNRLQSIKEAAARKDQSILSDNEEIYWRKEVESYKNSIEEEVYEDDTAIVELEAENIVIDQCDENTRKSITDEMDYNEVNFENKDISELLISNNIIIDENSATNSDNTAVKRKKLDWKPEHYPCSICNLKLRNRKALEYHLNTDHRTRVTCEICGIQVRNDEYLVLHKNIHNGKTENDCSFCDKSYARRVNVIRHMQIHFNKKKHQCERCGMFFSQTTLFYQHRLLHEAEDNPIVCLICNQSFRTSRTYKRHMITHQEDRPRYNCDFCGKMFVDKYTLKVHVKANHGKSQYKTDELLSEEKQKEIKYVEVTEDFYTCLICQHIFIKNELYNEHMQKVHDVVIDGLLDA